MNIKIQILQSSYYSHLKAAEELSKVLMTERSDEALKEANKISIELNKSKGDEKKIRTKKSNK